MPPSPRDDRQVPDIEPLDSEFLRTWPLPVDESGDKFARGTVLAIAGSTVTAGAAILAGIAALRMGAGRLEIATSAAAAIPMAVAVPEAMVIPLLADDDQSLRGDAVDALRQALAEADAVLIGPGMTDPATSRLMVEIGDTITSECIVVADAAALHALAAADSASGPAADSSIVGALAGRLILTPNKQELRALVEGLGTGPHEADDDGWAVARAFNAAVSCFGRVDAPHLRRHVVTPTTPGLGTSGSGDVLAGLAAGAAARCGTSPTRHAGRHSFTARRATASVNARDE